jgi:hypothetical protein
MGATPHRCANAASVAIRSGLSPAATSRRAAVWTPTPRMSRSAGGGLVGQHIELGFHPVGLLVEQTDAQRELA